MSDLTPSVPAEDDKEISCTKNNKQRGSFSTRLKDELNLIRHDVWLKALLIWIPVILTFILLSIFTSGVATNLAVGFVDNDNSVLSRGLIRYIDASPTLKVDKHYTSVSKASDDLRNNSIYALVVIPDNLEKNTILGKSPQVTVFYNSQFILIGKLINSAVIKAQGTYVASLETFKYLTKPDGQIDNALGEAVPISAQITPLFNKNTHYGQFLVSAAVPAIWQIIIVVTIVLAFSAKHHHFCRTGKGNLSEWLSKFSLSNLLGMLLPYVVIFWGQGILFLILFYHFLDWPMHGSWLILIVAQLFLVIACASMATFFFFISVDGTRAMSFAAGVTAPAFAFMGVTFPTSEMPLLAQWWRSLLPISHYIEIQMGQVNYGVGFMVNGSHFISLLCFISCFFLSLALIKKHINKAIQTEKSNQKTNRLLKKIAEADNNDGKILL